MSRPIDDLIDLVRSALPSVEVEQLQVDTVIGCPGGRGRRGAAGAPGHGDPDARA
jgi:hypothetical protein